ncbi:hypothetical protein [Streptomyces sp. DSM 118878]
MPDDGGCPVIPGMTGVHFVSFTDHPADGSAQRRASARVLHRIGELGRCLGTAQPMAGQGALSIDMGAGTTVIFAEARLGPQRHFLHLMGAKHLPAETPGEINLVSGPCVFGSGTLWGRSDNGARVDLLHAQSTPFPCPLAAIEETPGPSLYEYESVLRRVRLIADVAAALPRTVPLNITIDIPRVQYYLYLLDAYCGGLVSAELALEWFRMVDARHALAAGLFRDRLRSELAAIDRQDVLVRESSALGELAPHLRKAVRRGAIPCADDLTAVLAAGGDPVWKLLLDLDPPKEVADFGPASYVVEELRAANIHEDSAPSMGIAVENQTEWKVFERSRGILREMTADRASVPGQLLGVYPSERLLNIDPHGRWVYPYFLETGRHALDEDGNTVDLFTVIDELYA